MKVDILNIPWTRLIAEGFAIVISILLAFAIQAWWDERGDSARERVTLNSLDQEFADNRQALLDDIAYLEQQRITSLRYLDTIIAVPGEVPRDTILDMVWVLGPYRIERLGLAALAVAIASGAYGLIQSAELRQAVTEYDQALARDLDIQEATTRFWDTEMGPYEREHADLFSMIPDSWWERNTKQPRPDVSWEIDESAFVGNRLYSNFLVLRMLRENEVIARHRDVIAAIDKARRLISISLEQ